MGTDKEHRAMEEVSMGRYDSEDLVVLKLARLTRQPVDNVYRWRGIQFLRSLLAKLSGRSVRRPK